MNVHLLNPAIPKTRRQLADEYAISERTLARKLQRANLKLPPGLVMPAQLKHIYEILGPPGFLWIDEKTKIRLDKNSNE
jgi:hypothetical protein